MRCAIKALFALPAALLLTVSSVAAHDFTQPTLERIKETGKIRVGYGVTAPFSFTTPDGKVIGYSIDICRRLADRLKERLQMSAIEVVLVPRTPSNRVQLLNNGDMDIECNASTNTAERRKSVRFAISHFYGATRYVSLAKNDLHTVSDLKGRSVSVALGTVNVNDINEANRTKKLNVSVVPVDTLQAAFDMVTDGRVSAFAMDEVLLGTMIARSKDPAEYSISTEKLTDPQPFGFMMRLDDRAFATAVNEELAQIYKSPEMPALYSRWFESPIPEIGITVNLPMSDLLRQALANPVPVE
ncbi:amino acid ABC transporter substrate-binding protein [Agrobacterium vaccinii]|uniref:amino acid ABC transporter substrate-binding protein n=1 Tax=Agrobacterium vaccinii TaxID=2735528 RepID=UPI001E2F41D5|nr:amino acid ABC transporter substrate-binding protein [Agrobacterium vaccinii]UHS59474.1 amino acid ABC transporter substrate-binding protein [Agrobacterium vaccinii]